MDEENNIIKNENIESLLNRDFREEELSRDKDQTERFIEELIISLSDIILSVIWKITRTEQRLINKIKSMAIMKKI